MPWEYVVGSIAGAAGLMWWWWMYVYGASENCPDCKRTLETCSCVWVDFTPWDDVCEACDETGCPCFRGRDWQSMELGCNRGCDDCGRECANG